MVSAGTAISEVYCRGGHQVRKQQVRDDYQLRLTHIELTQVEAREKGRACEERFLRRRDATVAESMPKLRREKRDELARNAF